MGTVCHTGVDGSGLLIMACGRSLNRLRDRHACWAQLHNTTVTHDTTACMCCQPLANAQAQGAGEPSKPFFFPSHEPPGPRRLGGCAGGIRLRNQECRCCVWHRTPKKGAQAGRRILGEES